MASYRLFFIGHDKHIINAEVVECSTDEDAVAAARLYCRDYRAVEVWDLARYVESVDAPMNACAEAS